MFKQIKFFFQQSWLLITSAVIFGLLLAYVNAEWQPRIIQNEIDKFNNLAKGLLTEAHEFTTPQGLEEVSLKNAKGKITKTQIKQAMDPDGNSIGWAFVCKGSGFADKIKLVVALDANCEKLAGFGVLFSNETVGFGDKISIKKGFFQSQFMGAPVEELTLTKTGDDKKIDNKIVAITGATVSSEAVVKILNDNVRKVKNILKEKGLIR